MLPVSRYLVILGATFAGVLGGAAALNLLIDPYGVAGTREIAGFNDRKPAEWENARLRKPLDLSRRRYDAIALGTSQVERGIDPDNPALLERGITMYNAGLSEERPFEQAILLRVASAATRVTMALVSLDFLRYADAGGRPQFLPTDWTRWSGLVGGGATLVSARAVADSARTVFASWRRQPTLQHLPNGLLNVEPLLDQAGAPDCRAAFDAVDSAYLNVSYGPMLARENELRRTGFDHTALKDLLQTARRSGIELHVFIGPSHVRQAEIVSMLGLDDLYEQWVLELAGALAEEAALEPGRRPYPLWDFGGYNAVTSEPVPPAGAGIRMRWYTDPVHYTTRAGRAIEDRILNLSSPGQTDLADFGEEVALPTIRQHFGKRRLEHRRYSDANPAIRADVAALYRGALPLRPQASAASHSH
jgi:hypothetical protein